MKNARINVPDFRFIFFNSYFCHSHEEIENSHREALLYLYSILPHPRERFVCCQPSHRSFTVTLVVNPLSLVHVSRVIPPHTPPVSCIVHPITLVPRMFAVVHDTLQFKSCCIGPTNKLIQRQLATFLMSLTFKKC